MIGKDHKKNLQLHLKLDTKLSICWSINISDVLPLNTKGKGFRKVTLYCTSIQNARKKEYR